MRGSLSLFCGPMATCYGHSGPGKGSQHIGPDVPGLDPTLIHADLPLWSRQACLWLKKGHFRPFWGYMAPPYGHSGSGKGSQHIGTDVPGLDPTLIHADPPLWSRQACLWPQKGHFRQFWGSMVPPYGHSGSGKGSQPIVSDVPWLDPILIYADPTVSSRQACLWSQYDYLWQFWGVFRP